MTVSKNIRVKLVDYLRDYFANNRSVNKDELVFNLYAEQADWLVQLKDELGEMQIKTFISRYVLPKFVSEGWLKVNVNQMEVQLDPHKCAYCFRPVGDIYLIDIDTNKYCGSECTNSSAYYMDPYEWGIDQYRFFFYFFEKWLPKIRDVINIASEDDRKRVNKLIAKIEKAYTDYDVYGFEKPIAEQNIVDSEVLRMNNILKYER